MRCFPKTLTPPNLPSWNRQHRKCWRKVSLKPLKLPSHLHRFKAGQKHAGPRHQYRPEGKLTHRLPRQQLRLFPREQQPRPRPRQQPHPPALLRRLHRKNHGNKAWIANGDSSGDPLNSSGDSLYSNGDQLNSSRYSLDSISDPLNVFLHLWE